VRQIAAVRSLLLAPLRKVIAGFALLVLVGSWMAACSDSPTSPTNNAPYSQVDLFSGTGSDARVGNVLTVHYTGWFFNESAPDDKGVQFDSSRGGEPFSFTLGTGQVIAGWDQGVVGMRVGGVRRLVIPPSLAYGTVRNGPIPPNATLLFELELLDVQ
jgi:FKBP-type peptidyl-prolyl cis-trans isomerase FkpA